MSNLVVGLAEEITRNEMLLQMYEEIPTGGFGATFLRRDIAGAKAAMESGDVVEMVKALSKLRGNK